MSGFGDDKNPFNMNNKMTKKERADVAHELSRNEYKRQKRAKDEKLDNEARYMQIKKPETIDEWYENNRYLENKAEVIKEIKSDLVMKDYRRRGNTSNIYRPSNDEANTIYNRIVRLNKISKDEKERLLQKQIMDKFKRDSDEDEYGGYYSDDYYNEDEPDWGEEMRKEEEEEKERQEQEAMYDKDLDAQEIRKAEKGKEKSDATMTTNEDRITNRKTKLRDRMKQRMKSKIEAAKTPEQKEREAKIKEEEERKKAEEARIKAEEDRRKAKITEALQNKTLMYINEEDARLMGWLKDNDNINKLYSSSRFPDKKYIKTDRGTIWISGNTKIKNDGTDVLLNDLLNETTGGKKSKKVKRTKRSKKVKTSKKSRKNKRKSKKSKRKTRKTRRKH